MLVVRCRASKLRAETKPLYGKDQLCLLEDRLLTTLDIALIQALLDYPTKVDVCCRGRQLVAYDFFDLGECERHRWLMCLEPICEWSILRHTAYYAIRLAAPALGLKVRWVK